MGLTPRKRQFLVDHLGEDKVRALEDLLEGHAKHLTESGVGFKDFVGAMDGLGSTAPMPYGGAMSWADLRAAEELANVELEIAGHWDTFEAVAANIRLSDKPPAAKAALLKSAVGDFIKAVGLTPPAGTKAKDPLDPILEDLRRLAPRRLTAEAAKAIKSLEASRDPASVYAADLLMGRVTRGG
jgi:hypothetical protein